MGQQALARLPWPSIPSGIYWSSPAFNSGRGRGRQKRGPGRAMSVPTPIFWQTVTEFVAEAQTKDGPRQAGR